MSIADFCRQMPKVELHVHLEGSIRPETVLRLAKQNGIDLPARSVEGLREWYTFRDFPHFVEVYVQVSQCIRSPDDLEMVAREFFMAQAAQSIWYTEVTFTASTIEKYVGIPWRDQFIALGKAREWAVKNLGVTSGYIVDIVRGDSAERAIEVARATLDAREFGVCALGLAGEERLGSAMYREAFALAASEGLPIAAHAGETQGPGSIREVIEAASPARIGHGVRVLEDPFLTRDLANRQIPFEVCPTSNVRLGVFPSLEDHALPRMLDEGLYVTINSDDPPMFNTSLTAELIQCAETFQFNEDILWTLTSNAARAAFLPEDEKRALVDRLREGFADLAAEEE